ncbi:hypothetical protein KTC96_24925 (plasmid) [Clostridium estertheticum]|uniref:hypothetical protein n=1 Tax=Clostridium estertheticum TaxID=238834 RepID=UPI001C7D0312|nr:hypothetical protein [Clostridium estertheticum]MBX4259773.1 hypothetical protein [Clostridium estertheticum]WLC73266.1 hypothetical protein KTC96_24925 [Clostridium estertheticum]
MQEIPKQLQCAYCIRNSNHGGECSYQKSTYDESGCLIFKVDERGCIRNTDFKLPFILYQEIPPLREWCDTWQLNEVSTEIRINRIHGLTWDSKAGNLIVHCSCDYFINEYHEDYVKPTKKPVLTVIK